MGAAGCFLWLWVWIAADGAMTLSFHETDIPPVIIKPPTRIMVTTPELRKLTSDQCAGLNDYLERKLKERETEL